MAEPLSIASGIAGLLSLGIQVTQSLITFYSAYKDQDDDLARIIRNSEGLRRIFHSLETAVQARQSQPDASELLKEVNEAVQGCREIIKELQGECQKFHKIPDFSWKSHIQIAGRRAAYPFRKSTLQRLQEDINEIHRNLSIALDVLQLRSHNQTQYDISEFKSELKSFLQRINMSQISSAIRGWLKAPDASIDHDTTCAKRHSSTGLWFINGHYFTNWLVQRNSFLWINGFAGCGKSVLCSTAIQHTFHEVKDKPGVGIAFVYFSFRDESKQDSHGMLRALLLQLSVQHPDGEKDLEQLYKLYGPGTPPVRALLDSLRNVLGRFHGAFILLDALDESPQDHKREDVLKEIETIREWNLPGLHLLVTSRKELDINESLDPSDGEVLTTKNPGVDSDIATFVSDQLKDDQKLQRWKNRHCDIKEQLTRRAQGVFRYVECQLKELKRAKTPNQLSLLLRSLPRDLDETYERILSNIDELYVDDVRRILTVLCVSTRPVTTDELGHAVAVDLNAEKLDCDGLYELNDLIYICHGLVEVVKRGNFGGQEVFTSRIAHFSVQEYLQSKRILQHPQPKANRFAIQCGPANTEIAQICIVYLLEPMLSTGILDEAKVKEFPLADFAAEHWYHHYMNAQKGKPEVERLLERLFQSDKNHFVTWIRLYNMEFKNLPWARNYNGPIDFPIDWIPSPLYYASFLGLESILNSIIEFGTKDASLFQMVNARCGKHGNALQAASFGGHEMVVKMLLDQGANVNAQGGRYGNALQAASSGSHEKVVRILIDQGANANAQGGEFGSALQAASFGGHEMVVKMLLDQSANVNVKGSRFYGNALQAASFGGHEKVVKMLLDRGANVNVQGGLYNNALQAASFKGYEKLVKMLLDQGANVNAEGPSIYGNSLQAASYGGHEKVVRTLLDQGANANAQGGRHGNALQAAILEGHDMVVQILLDQGADINAQGREYDNALQAASSEGHEKIVQILLDHGANFYTHNRE